MHLVLLGVRERTLGIALRRPGLRPGQQDVAEVAERACRVLALAGRVGHPVGLQERRRLGGVHLHLRAGHVDECMRAGALVADPGGELQGPLPPPQRAVAVLGEHRQLRDAAVRAGQLDRLAKRLEYRDRLQRLRAGGCPVAHEPVEPRQHPRAAAEGGPIVLFGVNGDRTLDRVEGVIEAADEVGGRGQLLEHGRALGRREALDEVRGAPVVGIGLPVRPERGGRARGDERVLLDDVIGTGGLGVMDDVGRVCLGSQQSIENIGVKATTRDARQAQADSVARQFVAEAHEGPVELEQLPALRLLGGRRPAGHDRVQDRRAHAVGNDRDELDQATRRVIEPRYACEHRVGHRGRQAGGRLRGEQLAQEEGIAAGRGVQLVGVFAREGGDRLAGKRRELEHHRASGLDRTEGRVQGVAGGGLPAAVGHDQDRGQRPDAASEHGEGIERRVVCPVHVLEHEDGGWRRALELGDQQVLDHVRRRPGRERLRELGRRVREVAERAQRSRDRQVVTGAHQHPRPVVDIGEEPADQRRLADPGLPDDGDHAAGAAGGRVQRVGKRRQAGLPLEQFHVQTVRARTPR